MIFNNKNKEAPDELLAQSLEAFSRGNYNDDLHVSDTCRPIVEGLQVSLHSQASNDLDQTVTMSMHTCETSVVSARILAEMKSSDHQIQNIASAVEEMMASVELISQNTNLLSENTSEAGKRTQEAYQKMSSLSKTMHEISRSVQNSSGIVSELQVISKEIGSIVEVINNIASNTNLLALNATIEAARAGEAGKGFAVVASEVKDLSTETAEATKSIKKKIGLLQKKIGAVAEAMETSVASVEQGSTTTQEVNSNFDGVNSQVQEIADRTAQMSDSLSEQSIASNEIAESTVKVADSSKENIENMKTLAETIDEGFAINLDKLKTLEGMGINNKIVKLAKSDHVVWKKKLYDMFAGRTQLKEDELVDHHHCRLGKWYDSQKKTDLSKNKYFLELDSPHREVHRTGILIAKYLGKGQLDQALPLIQSLENSSDEVIRILNELDA